MLAYERRYKEAHLLDENGRKFLLSEFPSDTRVRVDGHSTSPIFQQDSFETGYALHRSGIITDEMMLKISNIPELYRALHDSRKIAFHKEIAKRIVEMQQSAKRSGAPQKQAA